VSAFDLRTLKGQILRTGCMAKAARASATFPFLFEPVSWRRDNTTRDAITEDKITGSDSSFLFIDGGITDFAGLNGLGPFLEEEVSAAAAAGNSSTGRKQRRHRVVNLSVGDFFGGAPPGPSSLPDGVPVEVLSISIRNLPGCGPWAMSNGPRAVDAAHRAMLASLDVPLHKGEEEHHYELHIDTSSFQ